MNGHNRQSPVATATPPQATQPLQQQQQQEGLSGGFEEGANRGDMMAQQTHSHQHQPQQRYQTHREGDSLMPRAIINVPPSTTIMRSDTISSTQQEMYGPTAGAGGGMPQPTAYQQTAGIYPQGQAAAPIYQSIQQQYYYNPSTGQYYGTNVPGAYMPQALLITPQQQHQAYHQQQHQQLLAAQQIAVAQQQQQQQSHPQGSMPMPAHHGTAGMPMPSVTSVAQMPPVSVMSGAGAVSVAAAAQQSAAVSVAHGIVPQGTTHLQTTNVVVTSTGPGQPIPPQQQLQREKKLLKFTHPETKEELDLSTGITNDSKRKTKPTTDGKDREAEETDKSNHAKEFQKKIAERLKYGADSDDFKAEGNGTVPTITPPPAAPIVREGNDDQTKQNDGPTAERWAQKVPPPSQRQYGQEVHVLSADQPKQPMGGEQLQPQQIPPQHVSGTVANIIVQQPVHHQTRLSASPTISVEQQQQQQPVILHPSPPPTQQQIHIVQQQRLSPVPRIQPRPLLDLIVENPQKAVIEHQQQQQQMEPIEQQQLQQQQQIHTQQHQQPPHQTVPKIVGATVFQPDEAAPPPVVVSPTAPPEEEEEESTAEPMGGGSRKGSQNELNGEDDPSGADRLTPSQDESNEALTEERIRELEEQMQQMELSDENNNPDQHVYSRKFLYFIRKVTMALKTVNCPKSEEELEELGLSRRGMPIVQSFSVGGKTKRFDSTSSDQFKTPWQQAGGGAMNQFGTGSGGRFTTSRPPYAGRHSDNKLKPKKGPIARQSLDQRPIKLAQVSGSPQVAENLPRRSANAWKPKREERFDMNAPERNDEEVKYEKLCKEVRGLLNKVTPSTYKDLSEEFIKYKIHEDPKLLEMIIDLIFDKAVEEPHFCPLYSDLCKKQVEEEKVAMADKQPTEKSFRTEIIQKCQKTFTVSNHFDDKIAELRKKIDDLEEGDEKGRAQVEEEIEGRRSKEKRRLLGIIRFISQLYRHQLLIDKIINWCAVELIKRYEVTKDEVYIEYAVELLETVGKVYEERQQKTRRTFSQASDQKDSFSLDKIFSHLSTLKKEMSNRIRFAILEVEELRSNKWMPRGGEKGPKTIEEVHEEAEKEQQVNEMERIEHERKKENEKMQQQTTRKGSRPNYGGRSSADRRSAAAANVSSLLTSSRAESRIAGLSKLREVDSFVLGGGRKRWDQQRDRTPQKEDGAGTGDAAGGAPSAPSVDTAWRPTSRVGTDSPKDNSGGGHTGGD
ncbi:hypothetical protein niasHT_006785 [Heterodera trifolii]|uniref:MIF4G domain-containing protein n=1 Tax=Heterodera trifolii TaxID=157864 RepID=A0ABD2M6V9_9BILA